MKARRVVGGVVTAGAMLVAGASAGVANVIWCLDDPPVQVQTTSGTNLTVNTTIVAPKAEAKAVAASTVSAVTAPDGQGGTLVTVTTALDPGISTATVLSQVKRYHVSATASGQGGTTVTITLDVPTA
jgi:hypothetical protein